MRKITEPIQITFNIPPEEISLTQLCEICEVSIAEKLIITKLDAFYSCMMCAIRINQISELTKYLPN